MLRLEPGQRGDARRDVRAMYSLYWAIILAGIVIWLVVGLTVEP